MNVAIALAEVPCGINLPSNRQGCIASALTIIDRDITFSEHTKGMESPKTADDG
jgi:hypothetical protein